MSCHWLPGVTLALAMLAGATSLLADDLSSEEIETTAIDSEEAKRIAAGWVAKVVATGERAIALTGDRDKVNQAIGAVRLADQRAAEDRDTKREQAQHVTRVFKAEQTDAERLEMLIRQTGLGLVKADSALQVVVLSGRREQVEALQAVLSELDVPREVPERKDVVLDAYLIGGYLDAHVFPAMPAVPQSAVHGIRETFPFASYKLLEAFTVRATSGGDEATVRGYLSSEPLVEYRFHIKVRSDQANPAEIRLDDVLLTFRVFEKEAGMYESEISTHLTTREGKTVVVGKAGVRGVADGVFLVLKARFD